MSGSIRKLHILFEDNHCLAVYKPAGMLTAGDKTGDVSLLDLARQYIKEKYGKPGDVYLGVVHRLDRPVSGVVLLARTSKAAARLSEQFRTGKIQKIYLAWVEGCPRESAGTLTGFLAKNRRLNIARSVSSSAPDARRAVLEFRTLQTSQNRTLLEVRPHTGRPHQIRVQLAARGMPIIGDVKYGAHSAGAGRVLLHAAELTFDHPIRHEPVCVRAPLPGDWSLGDEMQSQLK